MDPLNTVAAFAVPPAKLAKDKKNNTERIFISFLPIIWGRSQVSAIEKPYRFRKIIPK
jgi:hypothetical protein